MGKKLADIYRHIFRLKIVPICRIKRSQGLDALAGKSNQLRNSQKETALEYTPKVEITLEVLM